MKLGIIKQIGHDSSKRANFIQFINKVIGTVTGKNLGADKSPEKSISVEKQTSSDVINEAAVTSDSELIVMGDSSGVEEDEQAATCPQEAYDDATTSSADSRYNDFGLDCAGFSKKYYRVSISRLLDRACEAGREMQRGNYRYTVFDSKSVAESALKMLLRHNGLETGRMEEDIETCKLNGLITEQMASGIHGVRLLGNFNGHNIYAPENLTHEQAFFSIMQTLELLSEIEKQLLWPEPLPELSAAWARSPVFYEDVAEE